MKIRRILPLLAIAAVALFALASCDQMLESIYPDQTVNVAGNNTFILDVHTDWNSVGYDIYYGPLTVVLTDSLGNVVDKRTTWLSYQGYDDIISEWVFSNLKADTYSAYVWIDYDNDGTTSGDYDYGYYWPVSSGYLSGGSSFSNAEYVYFNDYVEKSIP
jgi:hypothetical protein